MYLLVHVRMVDTYTIGIHTSRPEGRIAAGVLRFRTVPAGNGHVTGRGTAHRSGSKYIKPLHVHVDVDITSSQVNDIWTCCRTESDTQDRTHSNWPIGL